jgi:hypothetical protein
LPHPQLQSKQGPQQIRVLTVHVLKFFEINKSVASIVDFFHSLDDVALKKKSTHTKKWGGTV